jgi:glucose/arabinose dehydrogenase
MKTFFSFLILLLLSFQMIAQEEIDLSLEIFANDLDSPTDIANAGDDRLFIVEKSGRIQIIDALGEKKPSPFLDITNKVNAQASERGLLGLAFHPDYFDNGYFFVNYTNANGHTVVERYTVSMDNPDLADLSSGKIIITINQPRSNHNGGDINFGPDGYLYIGMGDGGGAGDQPNNALNGGELLGKMLRIDVNTENTPYEIPMDNPFVDSTNILDEIWALGLRNPWRFSFDRQGNMWIADVGQDAWEEIDFQPANSEGGENYGWSCKEGYVDYLPNRCGPDSLYTDPVFVYANNFSEGCSVTGGYRYQGCTYPRLYDHYIFTDYCTGKFWATFKCPTDTCSNDFETEQVANLQDQQYVSFGENVDGELFVAAIGLGNIYRVIETNEVFDKPVIDSTASGLSVPDIYTDYQWYLNGSVIQGATGPTLVPVDLGEYFVEVSNRKGCKVASLSIEVNDVSSIRDLNIKGLVYLSPNPAKNDMRISWNPKLNIVDLQVYDVTGNQVWKQKIDKQFQTVIPMNGFPNGMYVLKIETSEGMITEKLLKI